MKSFEFCYHTADVTNIEVVARIAEFVDAFPGNMENFELLTNHVDAFNYVLSILSDVKISENVSNDSWGLFVKLTTELSKRT